MIRGLEHEVNIKEAYYKPQPVYTDLPRALLLTPFQGVDLF